MKCCTLSLFVAAAALAATGSAFAQNVLVNPGFEDHCGPAKDWTVFGTNVYSINFYTHSGARALKMYGAFDSPLAYSGAYQDHPASAGQVYNAGGWTLNPDWDALHPWNDATVAGSRTFLEIVFLDSAGTPIEAPQTHISSKIDHPTNYTLINLTVNNAVAPAGTASVRTQMVVESGNYAGGAAWWDDVSLSANGGPNILTNASFEDYPTGCYGSPYAGWVNFGNGGTGTTFGRTGLESAKLFGGFNGDPAYSGWYQDVPATAGSKWKGDGWARSFTGDSLANGNEVFLQIEFYDQFGNNLVGPVGLSSHVPTPGDDTYRHYETGVVTAPVDTVTARFVIIQVQHGYVGGSTWWDDMTLTNPCSADFNGDGAVDFFDYDDFVTCFEGGACPPGASPDFNADGAVDFFDYDDFVTAFETPC